MQSPHTCTDIQVAELGVQTCLLRSLTSKAMHREQAAELEDLMMRWMAGQAAAISNLYPAASHFAAQA